MELASVVDAAFLILLGIVEYLTVKHLMQTFNMESQHIDGSQM
jgi:hypothetical protein